VVELLLSAGANVNAQNNNDHWGTTPLHAAAHANQRAIAELLIAQGADIPSGVLPLRLVATRTTLRLTPTSVGEALRSWVADYSL
jgi:ankyrin repeat protein